MKLSGKTILVTAAGQGIGRASALACAAAGAKVIATDINAEALATLAVEDDRITALYLDVTDVDAINALAAELPDLDGLFNCAGMVHNGTILDVSDEDWETSVTLNITSMVRMCRAFLPGMLRRAQETGTASILNMSSMASSI
ncbi:MAG: SDR family NAD(P)-dependent oxidoreductase, partial [Maritimibacter sp.]